MYTVIDEDFLLFHACDLLFREMEIIITLEGLIIRGRDLLFVGGR